MSFLNAVIIGLGGLLSFYIVVGDGGGMSMGERWLAGTGVFLLIAAIVWMLPGNRAQEDS